MAVDSWLLIRVPVPPAVRRSAGTSPSCAAIPPAAKLACGASVTPGTSDSEIDSDRLSARPASVPAWARRLLGNASLGSKPSRHVARERGGLGPAPGPRRGSPCGSVALPVTVPAASVPSTCAHPPSWHGPAAGHHRQGGWPLGWRCSRRHNSPPVVQCRVTTTRTDTTGVHTGTECNGLYATVCV